MGKSRRERSPLGPIPVQADLVEGWSQRGYELAFGDNLMGWLAEPVTDKVTGESVTNTLTLWHDGHRWRLSLHCRGGRCVSYVAGSDLAEVITLADAGLSSETLLWKWDGTHPGR